MRRRTWPTSRGVTVRTSQTTVKGNANNALGVRYIWYSLRVSNRGPTMWAQAKDKHGVSYAWALSL